MTYRHHANGRDLPPARLLLVSGDSFSLERFALLSWWEGAAVELEQAPRLRVYACTAGRRLRVEDLARAVGCQVVREMLPACLYARRDGR